MWQLLIVLAVCALVWFLTALWPSPTTRLLLRAARRLCGLRTYTLTVEGFTWTYLDSDPGAESDRPVVLLIHGYGADKDNWLSYSRLLKRHYRVIAPDLPGFGESDRSHYQDYAPRTQAIRVAAFCRALSLPAVHVTGSSMGGYIATWMAIDHQSSVASLVLMNAAGVFGERASYVQQQAEQGINPLNVTTRTELRALIALLSVKSLYIPGFMLSHLLSNYRRYDVHLDRVFWQLVNAQRAEVLAQRLHTIHAPTLIIWGEQDQVIDVSCAAVFIENINNSQLLLVPDIGHIPMVEAPNQSARAHRELIDTASARD
ncbi:MAG: alpha/beta hydrolase [Pseudomonadota bacterium]